MASLADVEAELDHVAVLDDVFFAFDPQLADILGRAFGTERDQIVVVHDFCRDETALEVRVNHAGRGRSLVARGRWMDNFFIERLWRSVKYEEVYLFEHATVTALQAGLTKWLVRYNDWRPHETFGNLTPTVVYQTISESPRKNSDTLAPEAA